MVLLSDLFSKLLGARFMQKTKFFPNLFLPIKKHVHSICEETLPNKNLHSVQIIQTVLSIQLLMKTNQITVVTLAGNCYENHNIVFSLKKSSYIISYLLLFLFIVLLIAPTSGVIYCVYLVWLILTSEVL